MESSDPIAAKGMIYRRLLYGTLTALVALLLLVLGGLFFTSHLGGLPFSPACGCLGANLPLFRRLRNETDRRTTCLASDWSFTIMPMVYVITGTLETLESRNQPAPSGAADDSLRNRH